METGHSNPWAALHIPLADTSDWFIKERETALQDLERLMREVQAAHAEVISHMPDTRDKTTSIQRLCGVSRNEANRRRKIALVCAKFPMALELLQAGKVSVEHLLALEPAAKHEAAGALLDEALLQRPEDFRDTVRQFQLSTENGNVTAKRQRAQRYLRFTDGPDGMVAFNGLLPPVEGATLKATLAAMVDMKWRAEHPERAKTEGGHGGDSHEQRMADALAALATGGHDVNLGTVTTKQTKNEARATNAAAPENRHESEAQEKQVVVSLPTNVKPSVVINFDVDKWEAEILGVGPIPVTASLFDTAKNDLYYAFKNMTGEILKFGRARYEPSAIQRIAVLARDRHCIYPDCTVTADLCEIHHLNEWLQDQGFTDVEVLGLFCKPHHRHIHTGNLKATRLPDGTVAIHERATGFLIAVATTRIAIAA